jgi:hypothetical protein
MKLLPILAGVFAALLVVSGIVGSQLLKRSTISDARKDHLQSNQSAATTPALPQTPEGLKPAGFGMPSVIGDIRVK